MTILLKLYSQICPSNINVFLKKKTDQARKSNSLVNQPIV